MVTGNGLTFAEGKPYKHQRKLLSPAFSATQLKKSPLLFQSLQLLNTLDNHVSGGNNRIDITQWVVKAALGAVKEPTFGYQFYAVHGGSGDLVNSIQASACTPSEDRRYLANAKTMTRDNAKELLTKAKENAVHDEEAKDTPVFCYGYEADDTSSDYDDIPYLNAVLQETPRFHPIVTTIFRQATHDDYPALYPGYIAVQRRDDHSHCCRERSAHLVPIIATICTHLFMGQHGS
ncbi:cytochrome p450 [Moniliophthora roreri]|nr:cytochrome p450 [Moniliophthora roreri]